MKKISLFYLGIICIYTLNAQYTFAKLWDKRFGGTGTDGFQSLLQTFDGGFLLTGFSNSGISGNRTESNWNNSDDYWIVKTDSIGNKLWDKRFGGTDGDYPYSVIQTEDNGFVIAGHSYSYLSGDKSQSSRGDADYWIVKIDSIGNKQWDKRFGGTLNEIGAYIIETSDKGYLVGGSSNSPGDGDKTEDNRDPTHFYRDMWVVKIDSVGNKQWDKRYGGIDDDGISTICQTGDYGYILIGGSWSRVGGDKTQDNWDTINPLTADGWIVKIDSAGNKQWDKRLGGSWDDGLPFLQPSTESGYILCGWSGSPTSGDKTNSKYGYWLVSIDSIGNTLWDKSFGTAGSITGFSKTVDNGYLISGVSSFDAGVDKSENNPGQYNQIWLVKTDSNCSKQWDKSLFTTMRCEGYAIQTADGYYAVGACTASGIGEYKTEPNWDTTGNSMSYDYWILKFCMDTFTSLNDEQKTKDNELIVYPNPFTRDLSIALGGLTITEATFTITNELGQVLYFKEENNLANGYTKVIDLYPLSTGIYFLQVACNAGLITRQVVKL